MNKLLNQRYIEIKIPKMISTIKPNFKISTKINQVNFDKEIYSILFKYKKYIDIYYDKWDKVKSYTNLYEVINYNNYTKNNKPITLYEPISRAYYKLWEILCKLNIIDHKKRKYVYCALAEGPGGFVECFVNYRKKHFQGKEDTIYCITLQTKNNKKKNIPDWHKIKEFLKTKRNQITILKGADNTGNLYKVENIQYLIDTIKDKCDFVTGDGGFDYSKDFNKQEQFSYHLIFCEIVSAFAILKKGGIFILKIFEIHTMLTLEFLFLLNNYFETVTIVKPYTSRPANSEKYVVCKNFKTISKENLSTLLMLVKKWSYLNHTQYVNNLFDFKIPSYYKKIISMTNYYYSKKQVTNILNTLLLINNKLTEEQKTYLVKKQVVYSLIWCEIFKQSINFKSKFLTIFK